MNIKLDQFEGPLDLLLHLIEKAEVDIYDIPIADITKQYLQVLQEAKELELGVTSEFLVMAATLLSIKSRMLLPPSANSDEQREEGEYLDPRQELVEKLLEYKQYRAISEVLREKEEGRSLVFSRLPMDLSHLPIQEIPNPELSPELLLRALVLLYESKKSPQPIRKVEREEISITQCIAEIRIQLRKGNLFFSQLVSRIHSKERIVTTFLALLELMKQQQIVCTQHHVFEDIQISWVTTE